MKYLSYFPIVLSIASLLAVGCEREETSVPEPVSGLKAYPGLYRAKVEFTVPEDAVMTRVFHSSGKVVETPVENPSSIQSVIVDGLASGDNTIRVVTLNEKGKNSDPRGVVVRVFDDSFGSNLKNRELIDQSTISLNTVEFYFGDALENEVELRIDYTSVSGEQKTRNISPGESIVRIDDIDLSKDYFYYTVFKPAADFIDEFKSSSINARMASMKNFEKGVWTASGGSASMAIDDKEATKWIAKSATESSLTIDMKVEKIYNGFYIVQSGDFTTTTFASRFRFESSNDNMNWEVVKEAKLKLDSYRHKYEFSKPVSSRYFRITFTEAYSPSLPVAIAEIDLYNELRASGENGDVLPEIVNGKYPFETDGSDRFPAVGAGRFQQVKDWIHENAYISADGQSFCVWCAAAWGCSTIDNGKIYQVLNLLPGVYGFKMDVGHATDPSGVDMFAVVAKGAGLPGMNVLSSSEDVLAYGDVVAKVSSVFTVPFVVKEPSVVSLGVVYSLYNLYNFSTGAGYVWTDMYMKGFEIEAQ